MSTMLTIIQALGTAGGLLCLLKVGLVVGEDISDWLRRRRAASRAIITYDSRRR
jgi:hypothetical protein